MIKEKKEIKNLLGNTLTLYRRGERVPLRGLKKWVAALRSGKYKQGTGYLCYNEEYCCLGVFCEAMEVDSMSTGLKYKIYGTPDQRTGRVLPDCMIQAYLSDDGDFPRGEAMSHTEVVYNSLTELNDSEIYDFGMIADVIEFFWKEQETNEGNE